MDSGGEKRASLVLFTLVQKRPAARRTDAEAGRSIKERETENLSPLTQERGGIIKRKMV